MGQEERKGELDQPEVSKDEALRAAVHSFYRVVADIDADSIRVFRAVLRVEEQLRIFDETSEDDQMRVVAISKLTVAEVQLLSELGVYSPGLHDVRTIIGCYMLLLDLGHLEDKSSSKK